MILFDYKDYNANAWYDGMLLAAPLVVLCAKQSTENAYFMTKHRCNCFFRSQCAPFDALSIHVM